MGIKEYFTGGEEGREAEEELLEIEETMHERQWAYVDDETLKRRKAELEAKASPHRTRQLVAIVLAGTVVIGGAGVVGVATGEFGDRYEMDSRNGDLVFKKEKQKQNHRIILQ